MSLRKHAIRLFPTYNVGNYIINSENKAVIEAVLNNKRYVIKIQHCATDKEQRSILKEIEIQSKFAEETGLSPRIIHVVRECLYVAFVMDRIDNSLDVLLQVRNDWRILCSQFIEFLGNLFYELQRMDIRHQDINIGNIGITRRNGELGFYLLDFGCAEYGCDLKQDFLILLYYCRIDVFPEEYKGTEVIFENPKIPERLYKSLVELYNEWFYEDLDIYTPPIELEEYAPTRELF